MIMITKYFKPSCLVLMILVVLALCLGSGCAILQVRQVEPVSIFTLTIEGEEIIIVLPEGFPDMDEAVGGTDLYWDDGVSAQHFWLYSDYSQGFIRFFYVEKTVFGLGWQNADGINTMWLYRKGVAKRVTMEEFIVACASIQVTPLKSI